MLATATDHPRAGTEGDLMNMRLDSATGATTEPTSAGVDIEAAATDIFHYVHETDGGHKSDFSQGRVIEILKRHCATRESNHEAVN